MKGQKLYQKAKKIIPGGTMLLSKRPEMFLPNLWPAYFSKAKGCNVWDLEGNKYMDFSIMGIGTNILGYGNEEVDESVREVIEKGNMSTFNCPEEVYLAEKLIEINPWSDCVRFSRGGGEANALAIRIARASSGKDKIAICGYHGWHDWYISINHNSKKGLDDHLLPGLVPNGVPKSLKDTVYPFEYNNLNQLLKICEENEIGVIKMEVVRNVGPENDFLLKVRDLANKRGIILIFDECTSGFRETYGGIHKKFNVEPDMAMYGKALGNGYAITAVLGKRDIMSAVENTFISSTFWTERIGPSAALKTLEVMKRTKSWEVITEVGKKVRSGWGIISKKNSLDITIEGIPSLSSYKFNSNNDLYQTFITQEMLKRGFLASNRFYASISHDDEKIELYLANLNEVFFELKQNIDDGIAIESILASATRHSGFKRLN